MSGVLSIAIFVPLCIVLVIQDKKSWLLISISSLNNVKTFAL